MAVQIFGTSKSFDTKKAERWFSERRIQVHSVSLKDKGISAAELESVITCLAKETGSKEDALQLVIDKNAKDYSSVAYLDEGDKFNKLLENPLLLRQPIVRNGKNAATVGFCPEIWSKWL